MSDDPTGIYSGSSALMTFATPTPQCLTLMSTKGGMLVRIGYDGSLEFGPGYEPNEAARVFWTAVAGERKSRTESGDA